MHPHESALLDRHDKLERRLEQELSRPRPDEAAVKQLKIAKLHVKDALASSWLRRRRPKTTQNKAVSNA